MKNKKKFINPLLLFLALFSFFSFASTQVQGVRVWPSPDNTRVVFDLSDAPEYKYFMLDNPTRLVIDLNNVKSGAKLPAVSGESSLIKVIRSSVDANKMRIVLDLTKSTKASVFALAPTAPYGHRLVVDLPDTQAVQKKPSTPAAQVAAFEKDVADKPASRVARDIIIAIDAGHGGEDPGSIGPSGFYEKNITLPVSKQLAQLINRQPGMRAMMVRTNDYYVHVNRRTEIARGYKADLLISVHADAFTSPQPRGASVWVLSSRRATTEVGRMLEQTELHSELLGGVAEVIKDSANERYLAQTVLDLSMNHSMVTSYQVAGEMLSELGKIAYLHKKEPQAASLGVLKAPDVPSILVEIGFISNPQEEKLLRSPSHQTKLAQALFNAVKRHFEKSPPADSLFALQRAREHRVASGESLSLLAQRYNVSIDSLRTHNQLKTDSLRVGQTLRIP